MPANASASVAAAKAEIVVLRFMNVFPSLKYLVLAHPCVQTLLSLSALYMYAATQRNRVSHFVRFPTNAAACRRNGHVPLVIQITPFSMLAISTAGRYPGLKIVVRMPEAPSRLGVLYYSSATGNRPVAR